MLWGPNLTIPGSVSSPVLEDSGLFEESLPPLDIEAAEVAADRAGLRPDIVFPESSTVSLSVAEVGKTAFPGDADFTDAVKGLPAGLQDKLKSTIGAEFTALRPVPVGKLRRPL